MCVCVFYPKLFGNGGNDMSKWHIHNRSSLICQQGLWLWFFGINIRKYSDLWQTDNSTSRDDVMASTRLQMAISASSRIA